MNNSFDPQPCHTCGKLTFAYTCRACGKAAAAAAVPVLWVRDTVNGSEPWRRLENVSAETRRNLAATGHVLDGDDAAHAAAEIARHQTSIAVAMHSDPHFT